ncbi:MAG: hypothetical protein J0L66_15375 [Cytophagales bacterium]|nr:hypothetical protein [Cytophagales bacterium]
MKHTGVVLIIICLGACTDFEPFKGEKVKQYASSVIAFSSQYSTTNWAATRALGEENVYPTHDDLPNAWASLTADGQREFLVLGFSEQQTVKKIEIFETYNPGAIDTVLLRNAATQKWVTVYSKPAATDLPKQSRILAIHLIETTFMADAIRMAINSAAVDGWNEIDAVAITGQK